MQKRFVAIWFCHLKTDWMIMRQPHLKGVPFVLASPDHGRMRVTDVSMVAKTKGLYNAMVVADARAILPAVVVLDDQAGLADKLLKKICIWCIRFTPITCIDNDDGVILDATGCAHLWGGEENYLKTILDKLTGFGFHVRAVIADTIGAAWAVCRYGKNKMIISSNEQTEVLMNLPLAALRIEAAITEKFSKLGLYKIAAIMHMQRSALRRRFGQSLLLRIDQALGKEEEIIQPVIPIDAYFERLPCLETIQTKKGIEIALEKLLHKICSRLQKEGKGLRNALFKAYRVDNKTQQLNIITNHPSNNVSHLFKLFELKISTIEPAEGIELFTLETSKVEDVIAAQESFWTANSSLQSTEIAELLDGLQSKFGNDIVHRYLPDEHHLPEHSIKPSCSLQEKPTRGWRTDKLRPIQLLHHPERIIVTAPIPDYPPMNFRYKNKLHIIKKADACERIEPEWWLKNDLHRDYYIVEDEEGKRFWLYRLGHYNEESDPVWFIHGFFA